MLWCDRGIDATSRTLLPPPDSSGVREGDLVNWYLKEVADDIENVEELTEKKLLVEKVIERLVQHVSQSGVHVQLASSPWADLSLM